MVAISVFIFMIKDDVEKLAVVGYPGIFFVSFLAYATVLLPAPGIAIIFSLGGVFPPVFVGLVAGFGAALGELVGYVAGFSSQGILDSNRWYERVYTWMNKNSTLTILLLSALPNPFFDIVGIVAGAFKIPVKRFFVLSWIGESIKMIIFAYLGAYAFQILGRFS